MKSEQGRELDLSSWSVRLFDSGICRRCFDQAMLSRYQIMQIQPSRPCLSLEQEQDSNNNININNNQIREHNPSTAATQQLSGSSCYMANMCHICRYVFPAAALQSFACNYVWLRLCLNLVLQHPASHPSIQPSSCTAWKFQYYPNTVEICGRSSVGHCSHQFKFPD